MVKVWVSLFRWESVLNVFNMFGRVMELNRRVFTNHKFVSTQLTSRIVELEAAAPSEEEKGMESSILKIWYRFCDVGSGSSWPVPSGN